MRTPYYSPARYAIRMMDGKPAIFDAVGNIWHKLGRTTWGEAHKMAEEWNAGKLTPSEACTIADHFLIAAIWADSPEGTKPRQTEKAHDTARALAREFVESLGLPLFRACLDAYTEEGLHQDCNGDACAAFGHDLFLTLAGHGTGFWDRDALKYEQHPEECKRLGIEKGEPIGDAIAKKCDASPWEGLHTLEFYRGWVYFRRPLKLEDKE